MSTVTEARIAPRPGADAQAAEGATETAEAPKRTRTTKPVHPAFENGAKVDAIPEGYNTSTYAGLKEENFNEDKADVFYDWKAARLERQAKALRDRAESLRKLNGFVNRKAAKSASNHLAEIQALLAQMAAAGDDITSFTDQLAMLGAEAKKPEVAA